MTSETLPRAVVWGARAFGYVWIGALTIGASVHAGDGLGVELGVQLAGYAVIGAALLAWTLVEARGSGAGRWSPALLGLAALAGGATGMSPHGALMVLFACIAAIVAGGDTALGPALAVTAAGILGVAAGAIAYGANAAQLIGYPVTIASALLLGRHRRGYRVQAEQAAELLARTRQLQEQQRRADVLDERARIAREIHDVLAHSLGGLAIQIQAARAALTDLGDVDRALDMLGTAQRMTSDGLAETRRAVHALRTDTLPLDRELAGLTGAPGGPTVDYTVTGERHDLPPAATLALLRIAQEALVNAAKHAPGEPVDLSLAYSPDRVRLTATNPFGGTVASSSGGYGLIGMRERLALIGGTLDAGPRGDRWTVVAELPRKA